MTERDTGSDAGGRMRSRGSFKRASVLLLAIGLLNSLAGYLREIVVAAHFGAGSVTDAFFSSYAFILTFNDLLVSAALTAALIPSLERFRATPHAAETLVSGLLRAVLLFTIPCALALSLGFPLIVRILIPGLGATEMAAAVAHGRWLVWLIPVYGLFFLATLTLNAHHRFVAPAIGWLTINLLFAALVALLARPLGPHALLAGAMAGPVLATAFLLGQVHRLGLLRPLATPFASEPLRYAMRLARPVLLTLGIGSSLGLLMVSHLMVRAWGSHVGPGGVSALTYAFRIYEVPLTLAAHVAGTLVLPAVASLHGRGDWPRIAGLSRDLLFWGAALLVPASLFFYFEATPIIQLLLERRAFSPEDTRLTAQALQGFSLAIPFEAVFVVYYRIFYALHRPAIPVWISIATLAVLTALLSVAPRGLDLRAIALTLSLAFVITTGLILVALHRLVQRPVLPTGRSMMALGGTGLLLGLVWWQQSGPPTLGAALLRGVGLTSLFWMALLFLLPGVRGRLRALLPIGSRRGH